MTLTLTANIGPEDRYLEVTGDVEVEPGYRFRLDAELLQLQGFVQPYATVHVDRNRWYVRRGLELSVAASHTAGATIRAVADAFASASDDGPPPSPFPSGSATPLTVTGTGGGSGTVADVTELRLPDATVTEVSPGIASAAVAGGGGGAGAAHWVGPVKINCFAGQQFEDSVAGSVEGGTFTATHEGDTTPALAWDVSAADFKTALEALPSIGAGGVLTLTGPDVNSGYIIAFGGMVATELLTGDSSNLTGPDAPYNVSALGFTAIIPLATLATGDMLEDLYWTPAEAFEGSASLQFIDSKQLDNPSGWDPNSNGIVPFDLTSGESAGAKFTNFRTPGGGDLAAMPTLMEQVIGKWIDDAGVGDAFLPIIARNEVLIYATIVDVSTNPTTGEVWVWVKVATPVAP